MSKIAALLLFLLAAQNDVIQVNTRLVEVTVVVRDKNGPVGNLTKADFTVQDNKKTQRIEVFSILDTRKVIQPGEPLPEGVVANRVNSNGDVPATATVILFDLFNTATMVSGGMSASATQFQKDAIKELVNYLRTVRKQDRIALYLLGNQLSVIQDFTGDPDRLLRAATRIKALDGMGVEVRTAQELMDLLADPLGMIGPQLPNAIVTASAISQATVTADAFESIAHHLSGLPGRKNLIWMSGGFPFSPEVAAPVVGSTRYLVRDTPIFFDSQLNRASRALNNANVALYPVDVRALNGTYPEVMLRLANATGGRASYYSNDLQGAVRGAVSDGEVSYTLGFYSTADSSDRTFHNLSVKVAHKDVDVRHRAGYYPADIQKLTNQERGTVLGEALGSPMNASEIGLTANAVPDPENPGNYRVTIVADARDIQLEQQNNRRVATLILASRLESSKTKSVKTTTIPLSMSEVQFRNALTQGFVLTSSVAGSTHDRLKIVIQDQATGHAGSVWIPLQ